MVKTNADWGYTSRFNVSPSLIDGYRRTQSPMLASIASHEDESSRKTRRAQFEVINQIWPSHMWDWCDGPHNHSYGEIDLDEEDTDGICENLRWKRWQERRSLSLSLNVPEQYPNFWKRNKKRQSLDWWNLSIVIIWIRSLRIQHNPCSQSWNWHVNLHRI